MSRGVALWLVVAAVVGFVAFFGGRALKGSGPESFDFETRAPAFQGADLPGGLSQGGFTGFDDVGGLAGSTLVAGKVTDIGQGQITLDTASGPATLRLSGEEKLRVLRPHEGPIPVGATIVAITGPGSDEAQALLLLLQP